MHILLIQGVHALRRMPWDDPVVASAVAHAAPSSAHAASAAANNAVRLPGAIPKSIAHRRAEFEMQEADRVRKEALGVRTRRPRP